MRSIVRYEKLSSDFAGAFEIAIVHSILQLPLCYFSPSIESTNCAAVVVCNQKSVIALLKRGSQSFMIEFVQAAAVSVELSGSVIRWVQEKKDVVARCVDHLFVINVGYFGSVKSGGHRKQSLN